MSRPTSRPPAPSASCQPPSLGAHPQPSARAVEPPQSSGDKSAEASDKRLVVDFPTGAFADIL